MKKLGIFAVGLFAVILGTAMPAFAKTSKVDGITREKYEAIIEMYEERYGKPALERREYSNVMTGLCFTKLVDFDWNGTMELLLVYDNEVGDESYPVGSYTYEVWSCEGGSMRMLERDSLYGGDGGSQTLCLTEYQGQWYVLNGGVDSFEYDYFHGFGQSGFGVVHIALFDEGFGENYEDSLSYTLDGLEVSAEEWRADVEAWKTYMERYRMNYLSCAKELLDACRQTKEALGMDTSDMDLTDGDYVFPGSDTTYIAADDLRDLSDWELMVARNEIFARHGRKFTTPELRQHFESKEWYVPFYSPEEFDPIQYDVMSEIEWDNINLISSVEAERAESVATGSEATMLNVTPKDAEDVRDMMAGNYGFSSGVGAWGTELELEADGTFIGQYHDSEMGSTGDGYPNGSVYICNFQGKFTKPEKISDYVYSMRLESLETEGVVDESYIENGVRYVYSEPYGLEDADEFYVYLPGTPMADMDEGFLSWLFLDNSLTALPANYYGIYNVYAEHGFVGIR